MSSREGRRHNYENSRDFAPNRNGVANGDHYANGDGGKSNPPCSKIFITRFPANYEIEDLYNIFENVGPIKNSNIVKSNGTRYGFVTFASVEDAIKAVNKYHLKPPMSMIVNFAKNRNDCNNKNSYSADEESRDGSPHRRQSNYKNHHNNKNESPPHDKHRPQSNCENNKAGARARSKSQTRSNNQKNYDQEINTTRNHESNTNTNSNIERIVKDTTAEFKQISVVDQSGPVRSETRKLEIEQSPKMNNLNKADTTNPLFILLNKIKKARIPKQPWECSEVLEIGAFVEVYVVHVCKDSPIFYVNVVNKQQNILDITERANADVTQLQKMTKIEVGSLCLVSADYVVYRGVIETTSPYRVRLLDFGYTVMVTKEEIFIANEFFTKFPAQGICMTPAPEGRKNIQLQEFQNVTIKYTGEMSGKACVVHFLDEEYKSETPQVKKVIKEPDTNESRKFLNTSIESVINITNDANVQKSTPELKKSKSFILSKEEMPNDWRRCPELPDVYTKVYVTYIDGRDIYVNIYDNVEKIVYEQLRASNIKSTKVIPENCICPGKLCVVPFDGVLYRASITKLKPITAFLLDYGNIVTVTPNEVFEATNEMALVESQAIHVWLAPNSEISLEVEDEVEMKSIGNVGDILIVDVKKDCQQ